MITSVPGHSEYLGSSEAGMISRFWEQREGDWTEVQMRATAMLPVDLSCRASCPPASLGKWVVLEMTFGGRAVTLKDYEMLPGERQFLWQTVKRHSWHITQNSTLTILKCTFSGFNTLTMLHNHIFIAPEGNLIPISSHFLFPPPPAPGDHPSTFCLYGCAYFDS